MVINADDFYGPSSYKLLADYFKEIENMKGENYSMVGYGLKHTLSEHGHVSRGVCEKDENDFLQTVVERTQIERIEGKIISQVDENTQMELTGKEVVSMNTWGFSPSFFQFLESYFSDFIKTNADNPKAEFYIPFVVNELIRKREITLKVLESRDRWFGVTYKEDKDSAVASINALIEKGVYPEKLW